MSEIFTADVEKQLDELIAVWIEILEQQPNLIPEAD